MELDAIKSESFVKSVLDKYRTLTRLRIYPIKYADIEGWIGNFSDNYRHRYVAAHILDRLIFRSYDMSKQAYKCFLIATFRDYFFNAIQKVPDDVDTWQKKLYRGDSAYQNKLIVAPIRTEFDAASSGDLVTRLTGIKDLYITNITKSGIQINKVYESPKNKIILLIDDLLGSGSQIKKFDKEVSLKSLAEHNRVYYAPLLAMEKNLLDVRKKLPYLTITPIEIIEEKERLFRPKNNIDGNSIFDPKLSETEAREIYSEMLTSNGFSVNDWAFGHLEAALSLSFEWGCPNQTLGALWWDDTPNQNWSCLFRRRQ